MGRVTMEGSCTMAINTLPGNKRSPQDQPMLEKLRYIKGWWAPSTFLPRAKPITTTQTTNFNKWGKLFNQAQRTELKSEAMTQFCVGRTTFWTIAATTSNTLQKAVCIITLVTRAQKASARSCNPQEKVQGEPKEIKKCKQETWKMIIIMTKLTKRVQKTLKNLRWTKATKMTYLIIMDKI